MADVPERRIGRLIAAVTLDDSQVESWFRAFRSAQSESESGPEPGLDSFRVAVRSYADSEGLSRVGDEFDEYLDRESGIDDQLVRATAELGDTLPACYLELRQVSWLTDDSWDALASAWGPSWPHSLGEQLTHHWGDGWQNHPADHKQSWLQDLLPGLLQPASATVEEAAAAPADEPVSTPEAAAAAALTLGRQARDQVRQATGQDIPDSVLIPILNDRIKALAGS